MDTQTKAKFELRARILKALAHPTRLFIIDELSRQERCVCELTEMIEADTSTVSKHLTVLKNAGIVRDEKRGTMVYYQLRCPCVLSFFDCIEAVVEVNAKEQMKLMGVG
ncbi:metalloregulator ArsR/SmtB family transcription factor [candidate division KSB3 bacterium]|uniref:Metalloregulator ArsR/SmtB family transcription factor n=1 Tax=candidate division KSB3 bacterium TaxID=2044937 RepID=A0A9D5JXJ6_9BACT|nr:metalloregulator ArsR/SmtB family transcription factor [candidate division KSB3 bacterium]MBD3325940.1 metalloregulator ArsR/SmtB family transcription factor [candidate division KSB3 bacterium]